MFEASANLNIKSDILVSVSTITFKDLAVLLVISYPQFILTMKTSTRPLVSVAVFLLLCTKAPTSSATTAKPFTCSPARVASTAALSANKLV